MLKKLGKSDVMVNPIGLGANAVGGHNLYPNLDENVGKEIIRTAARHGMNFIDTAFSYGMGRSEELIGEVVKELGNRSEVVLATKGGRRKDGDGYVLDSTPDFLKLDVENSLRRLQTDYIDLYYIHFPDKDTPKAESIGALKELKDQGKIRAIGISNFSMEQLKDANQDGYVDVIQDEYNLLNRSAETSFLPYCVEHNISFIPYFPLASGLLAGKYTKDMVFNDLRANKPHFQGEEFAKNLEKVEHLKEIAAAKQVEVAQLVLAWYLTRDGVDAIIPGAKKPEQILSNLRTLNVDLNEDEIKTIDLLFKK